MKFLTRCLAVVAMLVMYGMATLSMSGLMMTATVTSAEAQRGRGRGGGGGRGMGRGGGRGGVWRGDGRGWRGGGRGRGRGFYRGGIWFPWIAPGFCHHPWTSARVPCVL
jgi:hypothetical protein